MQVIAYLTSPLLRAEVRSHGKRVNIVGSVKEEELSAMEPGDVCIFSFLCDLCPDYAMVCLYVIIVDFSLIISQSLVPMRITIIIIFVDYYATVIYKLLQYDSLLLADGTDLILFSPNCWQVWALFNEYGRPNWYAVIESRTGDRFSAFPDATGKRNVTKLPLKIEM